MPIRTCNKTATDDQAPKYQSRGKSLHPGGNAQTAVERQDLPCMYLARHVPESKNIITIVTAQMFTVYIVAAICLLLQKRNRIVP